MNNENLDKIQTLLKNTLDFTESSKQLEALKHAIFHTPDAAHGKVQHIKKELAAGEYRIRSHYIATRLLEHTEQEKREAILA